MNSAESGKSLEALVLDKLAASELAGEVSDIVVAALLGDADLEAAIAGEGVRRRKGEETAAADSAAPAATYLKSVTVEGFRGIGPKQTLTLTPGPGLTLVVGRNGSGKSSFAEAVELAMTGDSKRWSGRHTTIWRDGWRNLHNPTPCRISVELAVDGIAGSTAVVRDWAPDAGLDDATSYVQPHGKARLTVDDMGWSRPLELYRPFLSYSELGALIDGRPSEMYDSVQAILGLDQLIDTEKRLAAARKQLEDSVKVARQALPPLLERLREHADERAAVAAEALSGRSWDLDRVETIATGGDVSEEPLLARIRQAASLDLPDRDQVSAAVMATAEAHERCQAMAGTPAADARRLANLLTTALAHHEEHPGENCPVCGGRTLDEAWAAKTHEEIARLREIARVADEAQARRDTAVRRLRDLVPPPPAVLSTDLGPDLDTAAVRRAWERWMTAVRDDDPSVLATSAESAYEELSKTVSALRDVAAEVLRRREESWQPLAADLAGWLPLARAAVRDEATLKHVKKALDWLRGVGQEIRDLRLAPFAATSATVWERLRQESNVSLGPIRLEGAASRRRLTLDVTVDDVPSVALGVMSQGELHALGLALFLPRATTADSPFRFVVIDDPVQSMDPAKVDGLARLLAEVAETRQVVVFTHDDRLAESVRRLQLPATIWQVVRRPGSIVELAKTDDPVQRYLDDARALAKADELSADARAVVVAGLCRDAIEAACHEHVRVRQIGRGMPHADVERALTAAHTLNQVAALALFDDAERGDQVMSRINGFGMWAGDAFKAAKTGTHAAYRGDLSSLVRDVGRLCARLRP